MARPRKLASCIAVDEGCTRSTGVGEEKGHGAAAAAVVRVMLCGRKRCGGCDAATGRRVRSSMGVWHSRPRRYCRAGMRMALLSTGSAP